MKVLAIRFGKIGDMLLLLPPLRQLKVFSPEIRIMLLTDDRYRPAAEVFDCVDEIESIATRTYSGVATSHLDRFAKEWGGSIDIVLDFQAEQESSELTGAFHQARRIGFLTSNTTPERYTEEVVPGGVECLASSYCRLLRQAFPELPPAFAAETWPRDKENHRTRRIGLAPGGSAPCKRWPPAKWHLLSQQIRARFPGWETIAFTEDARWDLRDWKITQWIHGKTLRDIADEMGRLSVCVSNESGLLHLAAVHGCPTIGLFGFGNQAVWTKYSTTIHPVSRPYDCQKAEKEDCEARCARPDCLDQIEVDDVLAALNDLLIGQ